MQPLASLFSQLAYYLPDMPCRSGKTVIITLVFKKGIIDNAANYGPNIPDLYNQYNRITASNILDHFADNTLGLLSSVQRKGTV